MEKKTTSQKVKKHFKKHKAKYMVGGGIGVGVGIGIYLGNKGIMNIQLINTGTVNQTQIIDKSINILTRRGHAGNIIRCLETGETYASQNQLCAALGLNKGDVSKHLNGLKDDVKGYHLEKLGDFNSKEKHTV